MGGNYLSQQDYVVNLDELDWDIADKNFSEEDTFWDNVPDSYIMKSPSHIHGFDHIKPLQPIALVRQYENSYIDRSREGSSLPLRLMAGFIVFVVLATVFTILATMFSVGQKTHEAGKSNTGVAQVTDTADTLAIASVDNDIPQGTYLAGQQLSFSNPDSSTTTVTVPDNGKIVVDDKGFTVCGGNAGKLYQMNNNETTPQEVLHSFPSGCRSDCPRS